MTSTKRSRSTSLSSSNSSSSSSHSSSPAPKYARLPGVAPELDSLYSSLICTLPPTCSLPNHSTRFDSSQQAEDHYRKYHTYVCEYPKCRCVFPDARFLELHISECHDPIAALKRERKEKTFVCFVAPPTCTRVFSTPKGRRLHLIEAHGYPKQYFFAIVNKGIGGLYKKWGPAASLYRGEWKARNGSPPNLIDHGGKDDGNEGSKNEMEIAEDRNERDLTQKNKSSLVVTSHVPTELHPDPDRCTNDAQSFNADLEPKELSDSLPQEIASARMDMDLDNLSQQISSLSLVPDKIRFGKGWKKGGFVQPRQKR
ncbi:hypothetical protein Clacol_006357 [Clathrus columnatus]|uniref:C2H2-type domain-containing protein n=1 Tax=Clathrus columnatus TaxID=1419009 RepID=A0AAV5AGM4_9AGAM|nr:hypothetical protein Clacol_006357 [Clathrus columnatus]